MNEKIIENAIGWEDEFGFQIGYKKEFAFLNIGRSEDFKTPILEVCETKQESKK